MPDLSSDLNEQRILSLLMQAPTHMRAVNIDLNLFVTPTNKLAARLIKDFVSKYKAVPSYSAIRRYTKNKYSQEQDVERLEKIKNALLTIKHLPAVSVSDAAFEFDEANNMKIGRDLIDLGEYMHEEFEKGITNYKKLRETVLSRILKFGPTDANISRGMISDKTRVEDRLNEIKRLSKGDRGAIIPFGIKVLDDKLGGMRKSFVTLMYSKTGGGKTRTSINIAFNAAQRGYNVMYFSLEMSFNMLASCFDSRMAWINGTNVLFGRMESDEKKKYIKALKQQMLDKLNIWIVDVSMGATNALILQEIELYRAHQGVNPDLVVIDYANLMEPERRYAGRSEKYDFLFQEFHEVAKFAGVSILTATQESREASKADFNKKGKDEAEEGVHNIGLSNYMAPHCETVLRLKQDKNDRTMNRLWIIVDKNRYGTVGQALPVKAIWDKNYVGDDTIDRLKFSKSNNIVSA